MNLTIGADPEVFVRQQGRHVSGYGLIQGTKAMPFPVENGAVQVDGMALEFNINPANSVDEFVFNVGSVMAQLRDMVPEFEIVADPVARFTPEYLKSQPLEAVELGCDPDFNAWTGNRNNPPSHTMPIRTAAGHVHIGWGNGLDPEDGAHVYNCRRAVQQLDFYLGLPSLILDQDQERRQMYGAAGAFRPKPYGAEYRVLSNFWLKDERLMRWVFSNTEAAIRSIGTRFLPEEFAGTEDIINAGDQDAAREIIDLAGIPMPEVA